MKILKQLHGFLTSAVERHFEETKLLIDQLTDQVIISEPVQTGRPLGEIVLHIIRSLEFYSRGLATGHWEPLTYNMATHSSSQEIKALYETVVEKTLKYLEKISSTEFNDPLENFDRPTTKAEVLLEMLEHSIQHRGQILVYFRLLGIKPAEIPYII